MKKHLLLFLIPILFSCQSEKALSKYPANIGDIEFDAKTDNPNFELCLPQLMFQYFSYGNELENFKGEKSALDKIFFDQYKNQNIKNQSGLIRIRFVVNCKGETDRFRLLEMDQDYNPFKFDKKITEQLLSITKKIEGWNPKTIKGQTVFDYYQYLIFKIEDGNLIEILP